MYNDEIKEFVDNVFKKIDESIETLILCKNFLKGYVDVYRENLNKNKIEFKKINNGRETNE